MLLVTTESQTELVCHVLQAPTSPMSEELSALNAHLDALEQKVGRLHDLSVSTSVSHKLIKLKALTISQNKPARSARRQLLEAWLAPTICLEVSKAIGFNASRTSRIFSGDINPFISVYLTTARFKI